MSNNNTNILHLPTDETMQAGFADLAKAIDGTFRLLPATVTVANDSFTLSYTGVAPSTTAATVKVDIEGTVQTGLSYTVTYSNGTATFTLSGTKSGVYTQSVSAVVVVGDYAVPITVTGLPVIYDEGFKQQETVIEWTDKTQDLSIDLTDYVLPQHGNPAPTIPWEQMEFFYIVDLDYEATEQIVPTNGVITFEAGTLPAGQTLDVFGVYDTTHDTPSPALHLLIL